MPAPRTPTTCPYPFEESDGRVNPHLVLPYEYQLRRENSPVAEVILAAPHGQTNKAFLLTRYEDVRAALRDTETFSRQAAEERRIPGFPPLDDFVLGVDGANHSRLRAATKRAFTRARVEELRSDIRGRCIRLLDEIDSHGPPVDLVPAYAMMLALGSIADIVGVPTGDQEQFTVWGDAFLDTSATSADDDQKRLAARQAMAAYLGGLVAQRRSEHYGDLLSDIVADSGDLTNEEIIMLAIAALVAGWETTAAFISWAIWYLLSHPDDMAYVRAHPERMPVAVEELLRKIRMGPGDGLPRVTTREATTASGAKIPKGAIVFMSVASANHDESVYADADGVDLERFLDRNTRQHLSFGWGPHICLGADLARVEAQEGLTMIFDRFPRLELVEPVDVAGVRNLGPSVSGLRKLLVRW